MVMRLADHNRSVAERTLWLPEAVSLLPALSPSPTLDLSPAGEPRSPQLPDQDITTDRNWHWLPGGFLVSQVASLGCVGDWVQARKTGWMAAWWYDVGMQPTYVPPLTEQQPASAVLP